MTLRPVEQADLFKFRFIQTAELSPDGQKAVYAVTHADPEEEKEFSALWLIDVNTCEERQLTSGTAMDYAPQWSPDGKHITFLSTRTEKPQIYIIPVDGGEARQITTLKQGVGGGLQWSPDGKHLAFTAGTVLEPRDPKKPYRVARHTYRFNGMEYVDDVVQALFVVSVDGGEPRQVTKDNFMNGSPQWSPDSKSLLYLSMMDPSRHDAFLPRLRVVDLVDGKTTDVLGDWGYAYAASWMPEGGQIVFTGEPSDKPIGSKNDLYVVDAKGGKPVSRTKSLKYGAGGGLEPDIPLLAYPTTVKMSKDGANAYVQVQIGGQVQLYRVALQGAEDYAPVLTGDRYVMILGVGDSHLLYMVSDMTSPTELYISNLDGSSERRLTHVNDEFLATLKLPEVIHLQFPGVDGVQVEGWALRPQGTQGPLPTILLIHGGPHSAFGHMFHFDTQMLVGAGYAVIMFNHRASTGYGDEFSTAIHADWGNLDYQDLMYGVDYAIAQGIADPDRLGVTGLSGGGNLTCWTVGQTDRFKAAMPQNPVTNWVSFYGVSDIGVWFAVRQMGGHPHEVPEVYAKCSPITYAHRCKTPTLLVQGEHDWRCPPEQSEQFYTVLKANGCTVEMLRLPGAPHAAAINGPISVRKAHNEALVDWMNRYVLGQK